jgi:2-keto-4-pentenoate hydratase/2-oxohepta-3-ene-1,7-dioic acid hydratase in catechol pathway
VRIVMMQVANQPAEPGVLVGDELVGRIRSLAPDVPLRDVGDVLAAWPDLKPHLVDGLNRATDAGAGAGADNTVLFHRADVRILAPVGDRALVVGAGGNYREHDAEMGGGPPVVGQFIKSSNAIVGSGDPVVLPKEFPHMVDYEGELCVVFGRDCHAVSAESAMDYVGGYTILNDVSARHGIEAIRNAKTHEEDRWAFLDVLMGKQLPTFAPIGPAVVTADEVPDPTTLRLTTTLNGEVMQDAKVADLKVSIPELIEHISRYYSFKPGDVLSTGTPGGTGAGQSPPRWLRPGDNVSVEVQPVGILSNDVRDSE